MTNLISLSRCATIAALVSFAALPALANSGADSFAPGGNGPDGPGPGNWGGPDGFAPNPGPGPGPGPGMPAGGGGIGRIVSDPCPRGELVVAFDLDDDSHVIPSTLQRRCVITR